MKHQVQDLVLQYIQRTGFTTLWNPCIYVSKPIFVHIFCDDGEVIGFTVEEALQQYLMTCTLAATVNARLFPVLVLTMIFSLCTHTAWAVDHTT